MRTSDAPYIRSLSFFQSMGDSNFETLVQNAYLQNFPAQLELITEGDPADFLHVVIEGAVELYGRTNGREATMGIVRPVGTFILAAVLQNAVYLMSARTCQKSKILLIPVEDVRWAFQHDEAFARGIVLELASCYRAVIKEHKNIKLRTAVERVANRLIRYHRDQGETGTLDLPLDKRTMASLLGMTAENLSRAFNTLKLYGINVDGAKIDLTDLKSLEALAKPNPLIDDRNT